MDNNCQECELFKDFACSKCSQSTYIQTNKTCTDSCLNGFYEDTINHKCQACDSSCLSCSGQNANACLSCDFSSGKTLQSDGTCATGCPDSYYVNTTTNTCQICVAPNYINPTTNHCESKVTCNPGNEVWNVLNNSCTA